ncbi:MAG: fused MFS/spermidine synthase [Planctomycetes bacterium]|nr:fused MFS/spermidine synthase [Planctomycetota bacterium]
MFLATWHAPLESAPRRSSDIQGEIEFETKSKFSHIRIRKMGTIRSLNFVRDSGEEVIETQIDLANPHQLQIPYTQTMFAGYLFRREQKDVLIVGLGGGAMVRFLQKHEPQTNIDVVEIDPAIVSIADKYFGVRGGGKVRIVTADAFDFFRKTKKRYDTIYMDAFLKPSQKTDATGVPLRLKTIDFLKSLHAKLKPDGLVVFNLNEHKSVRRDRRILRRAFPQTYEFRVVRAAAFVVVATLRKRRVRTAVLKKSAMKLDREFGAGFSFQRLLKTRIR